MTIFSVGEHVRCDDYDNSGPFEGVITNINTLSNGVISLYCVQITKGTGHRHEADGAHWWVPPRHTHSLIRKYDPKQQGDRDDDV